eukprot:COSAG02_NODE_54419_length_296_cov_0.781726_1_plen_73_part_10
MTNSREIGLYLVRVHICEIDPATRDLWICCARLRAVARRRRRLTIFAVGIAAAALVAVLQRKLLVAHALATAL